MSPPSNFTCHMHETNVVVKLNMCGSRGGEGKGFLTLLPPKSGRDLTLMSGYKVLLFSKLDINHIWCFPNTLRFF